MEETMTGAACYEDILQRLYMGMLSGREPYSDSQLDEIRNILYVILNDYDMTKTSHEITVYEGELNDIMLKRFLICKKIAGCTDRTIALYQTEISRFLKKMGKPCTDVDTQDIRLLLAQYMVNHQGKRSCYPDNIRRCLSSFFEWMVEEEYIIHNPVKKVGAIRFPKREKKAFTDLEIEMMRGACRDEREIFVIDFMLSTGVRASEFCDMRLDDIDGDKAVVHGKGQKDRTVYLNAKAVYGLNKYLEERMDDNPYVLPKRVIFEDKTGKKGLTKHDWWKHTEYISPNEKIGHETLNVMVRGIGKRAGVTSRVHAHKFRRTFATMALQNGMSIEKVSKLLGHESIETTQIYLDITDDDLEMAHRKFVR